MPNPLSFLTRPPGPLTIMAGTSQTLLRRWVPKWHEVFHDTQTGLFHERVGAGFKPQRIGKRRLLSQLRQLAMYSHAVRQPEHFIFKPDLRAHADAIFKHFKGAQPGYWRFSIDDDLKPQDDTADLYTLAFVIFAMAHYGRASGDERAQAYALETAQVIDRDFRLVEGFAEKIPDDGSLRRHETHMHLLEACLEAEKLWDDAAFARLSDEIVGLFHARFYDAQKQFLNEYFTPDLKPAAEEVCEAGHYFEWIWLLKKHAAARGAPQRHDEACLSLLDWANAHGWDEQYGGIYDEVRLDGSIISERKRIWPLTEGLKANALLLDIAPDRDAAKERLAAMALLLARAYIQPRGFWTEWMSRDLQPSADYMPATTPYHVYFGIMESREALMMRGASKSWRLALPLFVYAAQRNVSALVRVVRLSLKSG